MAWPGDATRSRSKKTLSSAEEVASMLWMVLAAISMVSVPPCSTVMGCCCLPESPIPRAGSRYGTATYRGRFGSGGGACETETRASRRRLIDAGGVDGRSSPSVVDLPASSWPPAPLVEGPAGAVLTADSRDNTSATPCDGANGSNGCAQNALRAGLTARGGSAGVQPVRCRLRRAGVDFALGSADGCVGVRRKALPLDAVIGVRGVASCGRGPVWPSASAGAGSQSFVAPSAGLLRSFELMAAMRGTREVSAAKVGAMFAREQAGRGSAKRTARSLLPSRSGEMVRTLLCRAICGGQLGIGVQANS